MPPWCLEALKQVAIVQPIIPSNLCDKEEAFRRKGRNRGGRRSPTQGIKAWRLEATWRWFLKGVWTSIPGTMPQDAQKAVEFINCLKAGRCWLPVCLPLGVKDKKGREPVRVVLQWVGGPDGEENMTATQGSLSECRHGLQELQQPLRRMSEAVPFDTISPCPWVIFIQSLCLFPLLSLQDYLQKT